MAPVVTRGEPVRVFGTTFQNPILLAAGTAGFGREVAGVIALDELGGVVTKSVSPEPRAGHAAPRVAEFGGGMLNAVGLANPGVERAVDHALPWLADRLERARVLLSVVGATLDDFATVIARVEATPIVSAFEINLSCPNTDRGGEEFAADRQMLGEVIRRCRDRTDRPLLAKLPPALPDLPEMAAAAGAAGADGFTLVNTAPGTLFRLGGTPRPRLGFGQGGMSGPGLLPLGVLASRRVRERTGLPVIGVGGVRTTEDVEQYLAAGASLVGVGTAALADPRLPGRLAAWWRRG